MRTAYKLVAVREGKLTSVCACDPFNMTVYVPHEIIRPKLGKFFVFKDFPTQSQVGEIFGDSTTMLNHRLYRCAVDSLVEAKVILRLSVSKESDFQEFWKKFKIYHPLSSYKVSCPTTATYFCNQVVLLEDVTKKYLESIKP